MNALNLPFSFGNSGINLKFGLSSSGSIFHPVARWIVSVIEGGRGVMLGHLRKILVAVDSYYQPANVNCASEGLHAFMTTLCTYFVRRVHTERLSSKLLSSF